MAPTASPGRIVLYRLSAADVEKINLDRDEAGVRGNPPRVGDELPAVVVKAWASDCVNAQAFLDGPDTLWVTSRCWGPAVGQWSWPNPMDETAARVAAGIEF